MAEPAAHAAEDAVGERHQRDEGEHHRAHRHGELQPGLRALGGGHDQVGGAFLVVVLVDRLDHRRARQGLAVQVALVDLLAGESRAWIGHDDLGHQDAARGRHEGRGDEVVDADAHAGVGREDRARHAGHAHGHHAEQLRGRQPGEVGADYQGRLGLADEDVRGRAEALDLADPGELLEPAADPADHQLHHAEVVEDRDQRGEEDDHRQRRDREAGAADLGLGERAEQELDPGVGEAEQLADAVCGAVERGPAGRHIEHQPGQPGLQGEGRADHAQADRAAIGGEDDGDDQDERHAEQAEENMHGRRC